MSDPKNFLHACGCADHACGCPAGGCLGDGACPVWRCHVCGAPQHHDEDQPEHCAECGAPVVFSHDGFVIYDPTSDETGRFEVSPRDYYGGAFLAFSAEVLGMRARRRRGCPENCDCRECRPELYA